MAHFLIAVIHQHPGCLPDLPAEAVTPLVEPVITTLRVRASAEKTIKARFADCEEAMSGLLMSNKEFRKLCLKAKVVPHGFNFDSFSMTFSARN